MRQLFFFLSFLLFVACRPTPTEQRIISVSIEPQRYFAEKIGGDRFVIHTVVPEGQSPETYDPTPQQMVKVGQSEAYLRIGPIGFEQTWMDNLVQNNPEMKVFDLSEGMFLQEDHPVHHHHAEGEVCNHGHSHGNVDPHIWSSVKGAEVIARNILHAFISLDPKNEDFYRDNYAELKTEIEKTREEISRILKPVLSRAFIIYHPALTYFAEEFHLTQLCIEMDGKEPSPVQLKELVDTAKNYNVQVVFVQQEFDQKNATLIAQETDCRIISINPLSYNWSEEMIHIAKSLADE